MTHGCGGIFRRDEQALLHGGRLVLETCTTCGRQYVERYTGTGRLMLWTHRKVDPRAPANFSLPKHYTNPNAAVAAL